MTKDTGGPAFPFISWKSPDGMVAMSASEGMSLRDYIAIKAAAAAVVNATGIDRETAKEAWPALAEICYMLADAMLKERER